MSNKVTARKPATSAITRRTLIAGAVAFGGLVVAGCSRASEDTSDRKIALGGSASPAAASDTTRPTMIVHKDPSCGCCQSWADIAQRAGYPVQIVNEPDLAAMKARLGVPQELGSCHTTEVAGLIVEGHVPLEAVERMLKERPAGLRGLAVPGMPAGSPGMEVPDGTREPFHVMAFFGDGRTTVYA